MQIPRTHKRLLTILGTALTIFMVSGFLLRPDGEPEAFTDTAANSVLTLETPAESELTNEALLASDTLATDTGTAVAGEGNRDKLDNWENRNQQPTQQVFERVSEGDSMARIFARHGISSRELYLVSQTRLGRELKDIFPGTEIIIELDGKDLISLTVQPSPLKQIIFQRNGKVFNARERNRQPDRTLSFKHGVIENSLFLTSQAIGLPNNITLRIAQIFQWDIDFVLDIRPGDQFYVLYETLYLDGQRVGYGDILAAEFVNQKTTHSSILYRDESGRADYFTPNGRSMRKAFLRAPVEFSRISSSFNLRRRHPLYNQIRPHRGIDYAAPRGTPVLAAGDGRISIASSTQANGRYIVLQHGQEFVTKYLHLSRFAKDIRQGKKVRQGQVIGYVGSTGWATGPHLHYEFLVNGRHKNPRTVALPKAQPIPQAEMARFQNKTVPYSLLMSTFKRERELVAQGK